MYRINLSIWQKRLMKSKLVLKQFVELWSTDVSIVAHLLYNSKLSVFSHQHDSQWCFIGSIWISVPSTSVSEWLIFIKSSHPLLIELCPSVSAVSGTWGRRSYTQRGILLFWSKKKLSDWIIIIMQNSLLVATVLAMKCALALGGWGLPTL